jgi:type VI protein secretion system component VasF
VADEPSNSELWRLITDVRADLSLRLDQLVRRDVYAARESARDRAQDALQRDIQEVKDDQEKAEDRRAADRRLVFTALIAPVLMLLLTIYLASQGVTT